MPMPMTEIAAAPCEAHPALDFGLQPVICIWYDAGCSFGRFEWFRPSKIFGPFSRQRSLHINLWIQPPIRVLIQPVFHSFLATVWMPKATNPACFFFSVLLLLKPEKNASKYKPSAISLTFRAFSSWNGHGAAQEGGRWRLRSVLSWEAPGATGRVQGSAHHSHHQVAGMETRKKSGCWGLVAAFHILIG